MFKNSVDEKGILQEEVQDLKNQLHYMLSSSVSIFDSGSYAIVSWDNLFTWNQWRSQNQLVPDTAAPALSPPLPGTKDKDGGTDVRDAPDWTDAGSKLITLTEELRVRVEANKSLVARLLSEFESEKNCSLEGNEALQTAMSLVALHWKMCNGIEDLKMRAVKAGVKGAELQFIKSISAEVGLQGKRRDTAEAVHVAGELLVRLKDAEEAEALAKETGFLGRAGDGESIPSD